MSRTITQWRERSASRFEEGVLRFKSENSNINCGILSFNLLSILEITSLYPSLYRLFLNLYFIDQFLPFEKV